jgi:hypothetical protein
MTARKLSPTSIADSPFLLSRWHSPYTAAAPLFEALSDLEKGDGHKIYHIVEKFFGDLTVTCQDCNLSTVADGGVSPDADTPIQCASSGPVFDDLTFLKSVYNSLTAITVTSPVLVNRILCNV